MLSKQECRELFLARRASLSLMDTQRLSGQIADKLTNVLIGTTLRTVHCFIGDSLRKEVDTQLVREVVNTNMLLLGEGEPLLWVAPRMTPSSPRLVHYIWQNKTPLLRNRWGILEPDPAYAEAVEPESLDAVLVPLLGYDAQGQRVGYGGGYYDRFLAECRLDVRRIGLSFFDPIDRILDTQPWDIRLDLCVTPSTIHFWNN